MARRSLRLHATTAAVGPYADDSLLESSLNHSATYSTRGSFHWESMNRRPRGSTPSLGSLLQTPAKSQRSCTALNSSAHSCAASDASLLSALLDESCIKECTVVDSFWGLDEDGDLKDQTMRADPSLTQTSVVHAGYVCSDCTGGCGERRDAVPAGCSSASCSYSTPVAEAAVSPPHTTVYSREKSRRFQAGVLWELFLYNGRRLVAVMMHMFVLLIQSTVMRTQRQSRASFTLSHFSGRGLRKAHSGSANGDYCGTMNVNEGMSLRNNQNLKGPVCDDCKGSQNVQRHTHTHSSRALQLAAILCFLITFTGSSLLRVGHWLLSAGWFIVQKIPANVYLSAVSPGRAASGALLWLGTAWYQLVLLLSLLNTFFSTQFVPKMRRLLLLLLPLLLLLVFCWGPSSMWALLPAANMTGWTTAPRLVSSSGPAPASVSQARISQVSERLEQVERSLAQLWERVTAASSLQEELHAETLGLCRSLRDELHARTDRVNLELWVKGLLEHGAGQLRDQLTWETRSSPQQQEELEVEAQTKESRLAMVEGLQKLALRKEEMRRGEAATSFIGRETDGASNAALLAEVGRLEEVLGALRADLQGVMACRGKCQELDSLQEAVSVQVRQELRVLLHSDEDPEPPAPLRRWLSARYVSSSDLLASLGAIEKSILGNLSLRLEQTQQKSRSEAVTQAIVQTAGRTGLSEEHVQLMVQNALRLYSQDRIGLADYALESAGGSILSTRCSETYKTKTALMSLFGLPLWYFSQSPRAVIQPDVHPGNCWAFRGTHGYLVIRLSAKIVPTAFSLEHIPKTLSPSGNISSAPRNFSVYGLEDEEQPEGRVLGHYIYQEDGDPLQTYPVKENNTDTFQIIELRVLSNWGHPEYTCLYRFRVHGELAPQ